MYSSWRLNHFKNDCKNPYGQWYDYIYLEIHANNVEYPLAPLGQAVIRFSLNPDHTKEQMDQLAKAFQFAFTKSKEERAKSSPKL